MRGQAPRCHQRKGAPSEPGSAGGSRTVRDGGSRSVFAPGASSPAKDMGSRSLCVVTGCKNGTSCLLFPNQGRNTTQAAPECRTFRLHEKVPMRVTHLPRRLHSRSCWRTETRTTRQLPTGISFIFCHLLPPLVSRLSSLVSSLSCHLPSFSDLGSPLPALSNSPIDTPGHGSLPFASNFPSDS